MKLFAAKLLIFEIEKVTAPDGGDVGGQVCVGLFCRLLGLFLPINRSLLPINRSHLKVHVYHYQLLDCARRRRLWRAGVCWSLLPITRSFFADY